MYQDFAIVFCGIWAVGGLFLALSVTRYRIPGLGMVVGGLLGLAISLSY